MFDCICCWIIEYLDPKNRLLEIMSKMEGEPDEPPLFAALGPLFKDPFKLVAIELGAVVGVLDALEMGAGAFWLLGDSRDEGSAELRRLMFALNWLKVDKACC